MISFLSICKKLICLSLMLFLGGCLSMEWRGGMIPHVGLSKENPPRKNVTPNKAVSLRNTSSMWNQYRGPNRDGHIPAQGVALNWEEKTKSFMEDSYRSRSLIGLNCGTNRVHTRTKWRQGNIICTQPF
jgi:hypothetical protein